MHGSSHEPSLERTEVTERHQVLVELGLFFHRVQEVINEFHERILRSLQKLRRQEVDAALKAKSVADFDDAARVEREMQTPTRNRRGENRRAVGSADFISYLDTLASESQIDRYFHSGGQFLPSRVTSTHGLT